MFCRYLAIAVSIILYHVLLFILFHNKLKNDVVLPGAAKTFLENICGAIYDTRKHHNDVLDDCPPAGKVNAYEDEKYKSDHENNKRKSDEIPCETHLANDTFGSIANSTSSSKMLNDNDSTCTTTMSSAENTQEISSTLPVKNFSDDWTLNDIWEDLECDSFLQHKRPIHPPEFWSNARSIYRRTVGPNVSSIGGTDEDDIHRSHGFSVPIKVKQTPDKGRSIFADAKISAGSLVWSNTNTALFHNAPLYREFLYSFDKEEGHACDFLAWAYIHHMGDGLLRIALDLDEGALFNDGSGPYGEHNIGCVEESATEYTGGCRDHFFAVRDIEAGEELLCAYEEFAIQFGWKIFGL